MQHASKMPSGAAIVSLACAQEAHTTRFVCHFFGAGGVEVVIQLL